MSKINQVSRCEATADLLAAAYGQLVQAGKALRYEAKLRGRYDSKRFEALEEELARLTGGVKRLALTLYCPL